MKRKDIIRMAKEAGGIADGFNDRWTMYLGDLKKFAAIVAATEREECTKVCDAEWDNRRGLESGTAFDCAKAIRARGEK